MNAIRSAALGVILTAAASAPTLAQTASIADSQWFTGPLIAPSSAPSKAGIFEIEPYVIFTGAYDANESHQSAPHDARTAQSEVVLDYGITDRLAIEFVPSVADVWTNQTTSREIGVGDLPVELKYRFIDANTATGAPSVTGFLGMNFPTGVYDRLPAAGLSLGSGDYAAHEGLLLQSLFAVGGHALRLRLYADAYEPLSSPSVEGVSAYGTLQGFRGHAVPPISADGGLGIEYGLTQQWVLALDLVQNYSGSSSVTGAIDDAPFATTQSPSGDALSLAPAIEYNFNANVGVIAGVQFSVAGRNATSYVAPQIALSLAF